MASCFSLTRPLLPAASLNLDYNRKMKDKEYDLAYLSNGLDELESYLLSDDLFWPVTGRPPGKSTSFFKLTPGNLLLSAQRLAAYDLSRSFTAAENAEYTQLRTRLDAMLQKWQSAWQRKADLEYPSRFNQWMHTLQELKKEPERNAPYYPNDVRIRALLELLAPFTQKRQSYDLTVLDAALRKMLRPAPFIWNADLAPGFPEETFWYLYGEIKH